MRESQEVRQVFNDFAVLVAKSNLTKAKAAIKSLNTKEMAVCFYLLAASSPLVYSNKRYLSDAFWADFERLAGDSSSDSIIENMLKACFIEVAPSRHPNGGINEGRFIYKLAPLDSKMRSYYGL